MRKQRPSAGPRTSGKASSCTGSSPFRDSHVATVIPSAPMCGTRGCSQGARCRDPVGIVQSVYVQSRKQFEFAPSRTLERHSFKGTPYDLDEPAAPQNHRKRLRTTDAEDDASGPRRPQPESSLRLWVILWKPLWANLLVSWRSLSRLGMTCPVLRSFLGAAPSAILGAQAISNPFLAS